MIKSEEPEVKEEGRQEAALRELHACKGVLHLRVYNCIDRLITVWGGVGSNTCRFLTTSDTEGLCGLCNKKAYLFEIRVLYEDIRHNSCTIVSCPNVLNLDLCNECMDIDGILEYVTEGPILPSKSLLSSSIDYISSFFVSPPKKERRYFTSFESLEMARKDHDIKQSYEKSSEKMRGQFYDQINKMGIGSNSPIHINMVPY